MSLGKTDHWRGRLDDLVSVVWRPWRETEDWDDAPRELGWMFCSRPIVGRSTQIIERFFISRVWRQYGRQQDVSQEYCAYARVTRDLTRGWPTRLDVGRSMIDVRNLVATQWDYHPEIADAGMTLAYQAYLIAHPFPRFTDPVGRAVAVPQ